MLLILNILVFTRYQWPYLGPLSPSLFHLKKKMQQQSLKGITDSVKFWKILSTYVTYESLHDNKCATQQFNYLQRVGKIYEYSV